MERGAMLPLLLVVVLVQVQVEALAAVGTSSLDYLGGNTKANSKQQQERQPFLKREDEFFATVAKKLGLRSFTGGRGTYKSMAKEFLDAHNRVRAKYGVPPLRWSNKLARYARRWSAARRYDCVMMHSPAPPYGENVYEGSGWDWHAVDAVSDWASEASFYDWRAQACHPGQECGHFKQLVWRTTKYVGCGRAECYNGHSFFTCSYDPAGNYKGEEPLT
ncbi:pathogenesis-related protein 1A-like [Lolium rigidum]|uniref:pathogenesis-related protein 1A-like n=1 Tax=Lolium rigidum TaxID=89674 RepID=UPI001F5D5C6A|nr:pathogenesis-related protein 1A-like [Lolium rigidum]